jgi:hypothetical protein
MSRFNLIPLLIFAAFVSSHSTQAATYYVGNCKSGSFSTISAAISAAPAGSTIEVCPGTYAEQVEITKALTLKGISSSNSGQAIIAVPGSGLTSTTSIFFGPTVAPQLWVSSGPVEISNITVDGTGGGCYGGWLVGIFYQTGSSGTLNEVTDRNQTAGCGIGILAENGNDTNEPVTIENASVHNTSDYGIVALGSFAPTIKSNSIDATGDYGIFISTYGGAATLNVVANSQAYGILAEAAVVGESVSVSSNTVVNSPYGITTTGDVSVKSNKIFQSSTDGIYVYSGGGETIESNDITDAGVGIEFSCNTATVTHNTINDVTTGLDQVPSGDSGSNTFYDTSEISVACSGGAARSNRALDPPRFPPN